MKKGLIECVVSEDYGVSWRETSSWLKKVRVVSRRLATICTQVVNRTWGWTINLKFCSQQLSFCRKALFQKGCTTLQTVLLAEDQAFKHMHLWETVHIQTTAASTI